MSDRHARQLSIRLEGGPADQGRVPLSELLRVGGQVGAALRDVATVLAARASGQPGRVEGFIEAATELDVVARPRAGSFVLDLELPAAASDAEEVLAGLDVGPHLGEVALETLVDGIAALDEGTDTLPQGFDRGVLRAVEKLRPTLAKGVKRITLEVSDGGDRPRVAAIDDERLGTVRRLIKKPVKAPAVVEGRLQMVDAGKLECRIDRPDQPSVSCVFPEHLRDEVLEAITKWVRVAGEGEFLPESDVPRRVVVSSLVVVYEVLGLDPSAFNKRKSIEELAAERGIGSAEPLFATGATGWLDDAEADELLRAARSDG